MFWVAAALIVYFCIAFTYFGLPIACAKHGLHGSFVCNQCYDAHVAEIRARNRRDRRDSRSAAKAHTPN
jgi:hypothetical protein